MTDIELTVRPFRMGTDKESALKPLEEAAEVFGAWQELNSTLAMRNHLGEVNSAKTLTGSWIDAASHDLADELADVVQAACNLADRYGIDLRAAMARCEERNRERGRYE